MDKNIIETYKLDKFEDQTAGYIDVDGSFIFVEEYNGEEDNEYKDLSLPEFSFTHYEEDVCVRIYKEPNEIQYEKLEEIIDHFLNAFSYCKVEIWDKPNGKYSFYNVYSLFEGACKDYTWNEKVGNWTGYKLVQIIKNNINKKNLKEQLLLELNRNQLINKSKNGASYAPNNRKKGKNRFERRKYSKISTSIKGYNKIDMNAFWKGDILEVGIEVIGETDNYIVTLDFENILYNLKKEVKDNSNVFNFKVIYKALVKAFNDDDVYISCNCPDWKYRFGYVATKNKYSSQLPPELRPSNITNPKDDKGAGCKHTLLLLSNTGWLVKIASVIYNYVKYCKTNLSTNYKRYIFPQIYGMSYKQALDNQIFKEVDDEVSGLLPSDQKALDDIINRALKGRDEKGRFTKDNEYAFNKKDLRNLN